MYRGDLFNRSVGAWGGGGVFVGDVGLWVTGLSLIFVLIGCIIFLDCYVLGTALCGYVC